MSICETCYKDSKDHTKQLWKMHHRANICPLCGKPGGSHSKSLWEMHMAKVCPLCGKPGGSHSKSLWEMHSLAVRKAPQGIIWPLQLGYSRKVPAVIVGEFVWKSQRVKELKPIYMECQSCNLYLGDSEVDLADVLDGMCFKCFGEITSSDLSGT